MNKCQQYLITTLVLWFLLLTGCTMTPPKTQVSTDSVVNTIDNSLRNNQQLAEQKKKPLASAVSNALIPAISVTVPSSEIANNRLDVAVNNASAKAFFTSLAKDTNYNIVVSPAVIGNITLDLTDVTVQQVMDAISDIYGYEYRQTSYGYNVFPQKLETRTFTVSYLNISRTGTSQTSISSGQISRSTTDDENDSDNDNDNSSNVNANTVQASSVETTTTNNFWGELSDTLHAIVGAGEKPITPIPATTNTGTTNSSGQTTPAAPVTAGLSAASVVINPQAGLVMVRAYPRQMRQVADYLKLVQSIMDRQVIIGAKVLEVTLGAEYQSGIDWNLLGLRQTSTATLSNALQAFNNTFSLTASDGGTFSTLIKLINSQGRVNVISSPRITTVNNQKALIKVGNDEFFVTDVESNVNTASSTTTTSNNIELTPFFSGVALDVTPEIDQNGEITLHIHPIISTVTQENKVIEVNGKEDSLPLAKSDIRESDDIVRVKNRQIVVIGGLMEDRSDHQHGGTPLISDAPVVGELFKNNQLTSGKTEIVILLQPILTNEKAFNEQLKEVSNRYKNLNQEFSFKAQLKHKNNSSDGDISDDTSSSIKIKPSSSH